MSLENSIDGLSVSIQALAFAIAGAKVSAVNSVPAGPSAAPKPEKPAKTPAPSTAQSGVGSTASAASNVDSSEQLTVVEQRAAAGALIVKIVKIAANRPRAVDLLHTYAGAKKLPDVKDESIPQLYADVVALAAELGVEA